LTAKLNLSRLYARMIVMHPDCWPYVRPCIKGAVMSVRTCLYVPYLFLIRSLKFIKNAVNIKLHIGHNHQYTGIPDVNAAAQVVNQYIAGCGFSLTDGSVNFRVSDP